MPCFARGRHVLGCASETRSGNARGGCSRSCRRTEGRLDMDFDWMGSPRERVCKALTSRAHVFAWRTPQNARFALNAQGDIMAARVVGIRQEGIKSLPDGAVQEGTRCAKCEQLPRRHGQGARCASRQLPRWCADCELPRWCCAMKKKS